MVQCVCVKGPNRPDAARERANLLSHKPLEDEFSTTQQLWKLLASSCASRARIRAIVEVYSPAGDAARLMLSVGSAMMSKRQPALHSSLSLGGRRETLALRDTSAMRWG